MIYKAVEVIWIFLAGRAGRTEIEGSIRGPRGPKKYPVAYPSILAPAVVRPPDPSSSRG